ncbi:MAG: ChbG/HpnK family deacetylase [Crocinitomicaceae bacterium]
MAKPTLIFTADDFGAYKEIDDGIISALDKGWLNSVAMLANGHDMDTSVRKIMPYQKAKKVDIGLHFTFNSGRALSKAMQKNPNFTHHGHFRPYFNMNIERILRKSRVEKNKADLKTEIIAQIEFLENKGIEVKHLSSHFNTLHFFPAFKEAQFEVLAMPKYQHIKSRSLHIVPKLSTWALPLLSRATTIFIKEIEAEARIASDMDGARHKTIDDANRWMESLDDDDYKPDMPYILDGFHYQVIGSLGIGRSTKRRKAKRKSYKILEKVEEALDSDKDTFEFVFHLADPVFMGTHAYTRKHFKTFLNNKYSGVTPKYMDNRHVEYQSLAHFNEIANLTLDPQPWAKV